MSVMGLSGNRVLLVLPRPFAPLLALLLFFLGFCVQTPQAGAMEPGKGVISDLPDAEVKLECDRFGVGNSSRRGEWIGIRLVLTDTSSKPRDVLVRITSTDADGDRPIQQREVTLNPGVAQSVWMYLRLPFNYTPGKDLTASVSEALEGGVAPDGGRGYRPGALLARAVLDPNANSVEGATQGFIGVVGQRVLGLQPYNGLAQNTSGISNQMWHPFMHENTVLINGLTGPDMPDRWMGLEQFDAIVWAQGEPGELRGDKAQAVREWVQRGGHLIVVLPAVGQNWTNDKLNDLIDIMPRVSVGLRENVSFDAYRPLLIGTPRPLFPKTGTIHVFKPASDATVDEAAPILNGPDGQCVVVRRTIGAGAVTFIGIDLNANNFAQADAVDADVFWHRVLGRRGWLIRPAKAGGNNGLQASRGPWFVDRGLGELINQSGRTALGLLAALVVFVLYWAIAGPAGFFALKARTWQRHAWVAFLGATGVFTAVAWGGATLLRPQRIEARHVTILDHVFGQARERARMFASVLIPSYGDARLSIAPDSGSAAISPWEPPVDEVSSWAGFPDARGYLIDTRDPGSISVPTRATVKQVQLDWSGGPRWSMPIPQGQDGAPGVLSFDPSGGGTSGKPLINGILIHKLPGTLRQVKVIVVKGQSTLKPLRGRRGDIDNLPMVDGEAFDMTEWAPGTPLDMSVLTAPLTRADARKLVPWLNYLTPGSVGNSFSNDDTGEYTRSFEDRLRAMTFIGYLKPTDSVNAESGSTTTSPAAQRLCTHGYDLSRWLTQPCVIIIGFLGDENGEGPSPVPLTVDGKEIKTLGHTLVRWVYPLPANPPGYPGETEATSSSEDASKDESSHPDTTAPEQSPSDPNQAPGPQ